MKKIFAIAIAALFAVSANAQDCCKGEGGCCGGFTPSWFINLQGGVQLPYTPGERKDLLSPAFSFNVGRNITPLVSARIGIEGVNSKVFNAYTGAKEKFKYATGSFDAMLNVTNIFTKKYCHPVNLYAFAGVGCNWSDMPTTNSSKFSPNVRLGAQVDWRIAKNVALNLEYRADNTNDQFNGRLESGTHDWYSSVLVGVSIVIPSKKKVAPIVAAPTTTTNSYAQADAEAEAARAAAKKAEAEARARAEAAKKAAEEAARLAAMNQPLKETFFYQIRLSDPKPETTLDKIVEWCNKYPNKTVTIDGYADAGTGTKAVNRMYAKKRAQKVANALVKKGISADRLKVASHGDTVQPFSENDKNRCVIVVGE